PHDHGGGTHHAVGHPAPFVLEVPRGDAVRGAQLALLVTGRAAHLSRPRRAGSSGPDRAGAREGPEARAARRGEYRRGPGGPRRRGPGHAGAGTAVGGYGSAERRSVLLSRIPPAKYVPVGPEGSRS